MCELPSNDVTAQCAKWEAATGFETEAARRIRGPEDAFTRFRLRWGNTAQGGATVAATDTDSFQLADATPLVPGWWIPPLRRTSHLSWPFVLHASEFSRHGPAVVSTSIHLLRQCAQSQSHCGIVPAARTRARDPGVPQAGHWHVGGLAAVLL